MQGSNYLLPIQNQEQLKKISDMFRDYTEEKEQMVGPFINKGGRNVLIIIEIAMSQSPLESFLENNVCAFSTF